jgi:broad specificity phosphatase PhoE
VRRQLAERVLADADGRTVDEAIGRFLAEHSDAFDRLARFMRGVGGEDANDVAAMVVALRNVRALVG